MFVLCGTTYLLNTVDTGDGQSAVLRAVVLHHTMPLPRDNE